MKKPDTMRQLAPVLAGVFLLGACGEPIVARTPAARYHLANEQLVHGNHWAAVDTFRELGRDAPESEPGRRARLLHIALLGGIAAGLQEMGESHLAGWEAAGEAEQAPRLRSIAMDYFGRARGRSLDLVEALDAWLRRPIEDSLTAPISLPEERASGERNPLTRVREGSLLEDDERQGAEKQAILRGLRTTLARLEGGPAGDALDYEPPRFYLGAGRLLMDLSGVYREEALGNPRTRRLYLRRAASLGEQAAALAEARGQARRAEQARALVREARQAQR